MKKRKISKLKRMILDTLRDHPKSRDSDQWLTLKIWCDFFPGKIKRDEDGKNPMVRIQDVMELPREDHIKRIRAIIQNEERRYLPTSLEVAKQRKINEEVWNAYVKGQESLFEN